MWDRVGMNDHKLTSTKRYDVSEHDFTRIFDEVDGEI
jgi:hypothetical protein